MVCSSTEISHVNWRNIELARTQRRRNPIQVNRPPAKTPAAKTMPIDCIGFCLTVCFASSITSSAAWRPCLIAWFADRILSSTASVTMDLILETSRRASSTAAGLSNVSVGICFVPFVMRLLPGLVFKRSDNAQIDSAITLPYLVYESRNLSVVAGDSSVHANDNPNPFLQNRRRFPGIPLVGFRGDAHTPGYDYGQMSNEASH